MVVTHIALVLGKLAKKTVRTSEEVLVMPGRLNVIPSGCLLEKFKSKRPNSDERLGAVIAIRVASFPVNISKDKFSLAGKDLI